MAQFPALDIWTDAWLADTGHLPRVDRDIYFHLLILIWRSPNCRIPVAPEWRERHLRCTGDEAAILHAVALEFCQSDGNWLTQKRLTKEYKYALERSKKQSERAKSRWNKDKLISHGNAGAGNAPTATATERKKDTTYLSKERKFPNGKPKQNSIANGLALVEQYIDDLKTEADREANDGAETGLLPQDGSKIPALLS